MIKAENIKKTYGELEVLKGVDLNINKGEVISIVGASGAGKSTLLQIIGTLDLPDSGSISIQSVNTSVLNDKDLSIDYKVVGQERKIIFCAPNMLTFF